MSKAREARLLGQALEAARGRGLDRDVLHDETDFLRYIGLLERFAMRYTVLISVFDTPCGPQFTAEHGAALRRIGLRIDVMGRYRAAYAAIIDAGENLYEEITGPAGIIEHACTIGDTHVRLESVGFGAPTRLHASIYVDGRDLGANKRGFNFVVFDRVTGFVLDSVSFDTFGDHFAYTRPSELVEGLDRYRRAHPDVFVVSCRMPAFPTENRSENEEYIVRNNIMLSTVLANLDSPSMMLYHAYPTIAQRQEAMRIPESYCDTRGVRQFKDVCGAIVNTAGGHRVTSDQPMACRRTIFIVGWCGVFGIGASDRDTIASCLQRLCNQRVPEMGFAVENYGYYLAQEDMQSNEELTILEGLPVQPGDIVLGCFGFDEDAPHIDLARESARPHEYGEIFFDMFHYTASGYRMIAERLFDGLMRMGFDRARPIAQGGVVPGMHSMNARASASIVPSPGRPAASPVAAPAALPPNAARELAAYQDVLRELYDSMFGITIGAVVVNCNPFTLGHRYLIEQAAAQVDHVMVFVVQEDRSIFPFDDRIALVDAGLADLPNVTVIPSGRFIISSLTFHEYFNKSALQDREIDASLDATLFARDIAPCLHIAVRFVGEEPFDRVTRQYNDSLRSILPQYGIRFVEIPRKEQDGTAISASRVRALLDEHRFDEIARIVPPTTLSYLERKYA